VPVNAARNSLCLWRDFCVRSTHQAIGANILSRTSEIAMLLPYPIFVAMIWALLLAPVPLSAFAWARATGLRLTLVILSLSAILLLLIANESVRTDLMGPRYSTRLHASLWCNLLVTSATGYFALEK
jgi:hypothetical protein